MDITFDEFRDTFDVRRNPIRDYSPYENMMLDWDDEEIDYLEDLDEHKVWSVVDDGSFNLKPGLHYKDVIGFFVCRKDWDDDKLNFKLR